MLSIKINDDPRIKNELQASKTDDNLLTLVLIRGIVSGQITLSKSQWEELRKYADGCFKKQRNKREIVNHQINFPFEGDRFINAWSNWKHYKLKEKQFSYKTALSEQSAIDLLTKYSNGIEDEAIEIIYTAIGNGWTGFHPLRKDGKQKQKPSTSSGIYEKLAQRFGK